MTRPHPPLRAKHGFTLIEVLVAVVIVGTVLTAIATTLSANVKNAAQARYRVRATVLAQEGLEFLTRERQLEGWGDFLGTFPHGTTTYCVQTLTSTDTLAILSQGNCGATEVISETGVSYTRELTVTKSVATPNELTADFNVSWIDGSRTSDVKLERVYRPTDN